MWHPARSQDNRAPGRLLNGDGLVGNFSWTPRSALWGLTRLVPCSSALHKRLAQVPGLWCCKERVFQSLEPSKPHLAWGAARLRCRRGWVCVAWSPCPAWGRSAAICSSAGVSGDRHAAPGSLRSSDGDERFHLALRSTSSFSTSPAAVIIPSRQQFAKQLPNEAEDTIPALWSYE